MQKLIWEVGVRNGNIRALRTHVTNKVGIKLFVVRIYERIFYVSCLTKTDRQILLTEPTSFCQQMANTHIQATLPYPPFHNFKIRWSRFPNYIKWVDPRISRL